MSLNKFRLYVVYLCSFVGKISILILEKFQFEDSQQRDRLALLNATLLRATGYAMKDYILKPISVPEIAINENKFYFNVLLCGFNNSMFQ